MSFVFVSHAAPDKHSRVRPLVQALAIEGVSLWLDRPGSGPDDFQLPPDFVSRYQIQSLRLGQDWDDGIRSALRDAGAVLVCLSKAALEPGREVLEQEIWGAQLTRKAVTCIVDDVDLAAMPQERGLMSLGKSQSLRIHTHTLQLAIDWLLADPTRIPDQLPEGYRSTWDDVRRLRDELHRTRDEAQPASFSPSSSHYRWPAQWDFSAYMAEKRELFEGRDWLFGEIAQWLAVGHSRAMLIRADFGVGKSSIMSELVHRNPGGCVAAWHFCQHDTQETLQPGVFVRNLAVQLAATVPGYKELIDRDPAMQERLDRVLAEPSSALEGAVLAPLARLGAPSAPRLLVVDALDEALELDATGLRSTGTIVSLLAAKAGRFPPWLRVLATSRPNPQVLIPLNAFGTRELDADSSGNKGDLRRFILGRCANRPLADVLRSRGKTPEQLAGLLVPRSAGKFLYAARAMRDLELGHIEVSELAGLPPGMDAFYLDAFERRFARAGRAYDSARRVLGVLAVAREPLPAAEVAAVLGVNEAEVKAVRMALPDFLRQRDRKMAFEHFSMAEWLTRENDEGHSRAGDYAVDAPAAQVAMREWALLQVASKVAHQSDYLLRHLPAHLSSDEERRRVWGSLLLENFEWLNARLRQVGVDALIADALALGAMPRQVQLLAFLRTCASVLRQFPDQLAARLLGSVCLVEGPGEDRVLARLACSAHAWLCQVETNDRRSSSLIPQTRSLRAPTAHIATLTPAGNRVIVLANGLIASESDSCTLTLWNLASPTDVVTFSVQSDETTALAALPDGRIATGSRGGYVRVWDSKYPTDPTIFTGHSDWVTAIVPIPGGRIASSGHDHTIRVWSLDKASPPLVLRGHLDWVTRLVVLPDGRIVSGSGDSTVRIWDPEQCGECVLFRGHTGIVSCLATLPDGRVVSGGADCTLRVWDPVRGQDPIIFNGHTGTVRKIAVLPNGRVASYGYAETAVRVWNLAEPDDVVVYEGHTSAAVRALAVLPDGRIASGDRAGAIHLWDPARPSEAVIFKGHLDDVTDLTASPNGTIISVSNDGTVRVWDPSRQQELSAERHHDREVRALLALPDGHIASGCADKVLVWNLARLQDEPVEHACGVEAMHALPDGRIASFNWCHARVWDSACQLDDVEFTTKEHSLKSLAPLPDGRIALLDFEGNNHVWDPSGRLAPMVLERGATIGRAIVVLPDGRIVSACDGPDVILWDPARPKELVILEECGERPSAIQLTSLAILSGGSVAWGVRDSTAHLWDRSRPNHPLTLASFRSSVEALAALPDGRLVLGTSDGTVHVWDPVRSNAPVSLEGQHSGSVVALVVLSEGRIVSGSDDRTVRLWDLARMSQTRVFVCNSAVCCLAVAKELIVVGCSDGAVHFLKEV